VVQNPISDDVFQDSESISMSTAASIAGKIAFGPNAGKYVTRIGSGFGFNEEIPLTKGRLCFSINGFSLHEFGKDPGAPALFVFVARDRKRIKAVYWDKTGFSLWLKVLERDRFIPKLLIRVVQYERKLMSLWGCCDGY